MRDGAAGAVPVRRWGYSKRWSERRQGAAIGGIVGVVGGTLYGLNETGNDERYRKRMLPHAFTWLRIGGSHVFC